MLSARRATIARPLLLSLVGVLLGVLGARYLLVGSALSLVPWAGVAALVGYTSPSRRGTIIEASSYGFALAFAFMTAGYDGPARVVTRFLPFALLGLFGALCATLIGLAAHRLTRRRRAASRRA